MKIVIIVSLILSLLAAMGAAPARAVTTLDFFRITTNSPYGLEQLFVTVYGPWDTTPLIFNNVPVTIAAGTVGFYFQNVQVANYIASSITEIYFDDGFLGAPTIYNGAGVSFSWEAQPPDLPGGNTLAPPFVATTVFNTQSERETANGINPGEALLLTFGLGSYADLDAVLTALSDQSLRLGLHVRGIAGGTSDSYVNHAVPIPGALVLLGAGLVRLAAYARRKRLGA